MAKKLVIVMANTDPRNGEELGAPIFQASVAAAMEYEVDVICTATAGRHRTGARNGQATHCVGGGMGIATVVEALGHVRVHHHPVGEGR